MHNQGTYRSRYSRAAIPGKHEKHQLVVLMLGLFCCMLLAVAGSIAAEYEVFYFDEGIFPTAVSADGTVVAGVQENPAFDPYDPDPYINYNLLFRWTRESGMTTQDVSPMFPYLNGPVVADMSADGSVVMAVAFPFVDDLSGYPRAQILLWEDGSKAFMLPPPKEIGLAHTANDYAMGAHALSADGTTVGGVFWYLDPELYNRSGPLRWTEATGSIMLAQARVFPEEIVVQVRGEVLHISDDGSVVVGDLRPVWSGADQLSHVKEFFYWTETDGMTEITVPKGEPTDWGLVGLSGDGSTVYFTHIQHKRVETVWSWSEEAGWVTLLTAEEMVPLDVHPYDDPFFRGVVNPSGIYEIWLWEGELMVSGWLGNAIFGPRDTFLWTESGGLLLFSELLSKAGVKRTEGTLPRFPPESPREWALGHVGVSRDGKTIVGSADLLEGHSGHTGFVIYITETGEPIWVGVKDSDWFVAANWQSGQVPGADDDVIIDATSEQGVTLGEQPGTAGLLIVGDNDYGSLTVKDGAILSSDKAVIARQIAGVGAVLVIDVGSRWDNTDDIIVGDEGLGSLTIADHAVVQADTMTLGRAYGSTGVVNVVGGASLLVDSELTVGEKGRGQVTVEDGGLLTAATAVIGGDEGGEGIFTIRGSTSSAHVTDLIEVGTVGTGTLSIESGGKLGGEDGTVGLAGGSGQATVEGKGSKWELAGDLVVGHSGVGDVDIKDGGVITSKTGTVGLDAYGSVNVSGELTDWYATEDLQIGVRAMGVVAATDRAGVHSEKVTLAVTSESVGAGFVANGATWAALELTVGLGGHGTLAIEDGGNVLASDMVLGAKKGSRGAVLVKGMAETWSTLNVFGSLFVGAGGEGLLQFENGGQGTITEDLLIAAGGRGEVKVLHPGTDVSTANLDVGHHAGLGTLQLSHGGKLSVEEGALTIARLEDSVGVVSIGFLDEGIPQAPGHLEAKSIVFGSGRGSLVFVHNSDGYVLETDIIGDGVIENVHGHTIIKGDASGFTGTTEIVGGKLSIEGELGGTLDIQGGSIGGNGILPPVTVPEGGTVAPGGSIGTLKTAEITFEPGSVYEVEVNAKGESDLIEVTGEATIGGGLVLVIPYPDYAIETPYTILTAEGGVAGEFDASSVTEGFTFLKPIVEYDPNAVMLTLEMSDIDFSSVAKTRNQKAVAKAVEEAGPGDVVWNGLALLNEDEARTALDSLSGEIHASMKTALLDEAGIVRGAVRERLGAGGTHGSGPSALTAAGNADFAASSAHPASVDHDVHTGFWGQLLGAQGTWDGDGNAVAYRRALTGGLVGWDGIADDWRYGFVAGLGRGNHDVGERASSATSNTTHVGAYADTVHSNWHVLAGLTYSAHQLQTERRVRFAGLDETNRAAYNAHTTQLFGEVSHPMVRDGYTLQPYASLSWNQLTTAAFSEGGHQAEPPPVSEDSANGSEQAKALGEMTGAMTAESPAPASVVAASTAANATALATKQTTMQATVAEVGLRADTRFYMGSLPADAYGVIGWRYAFGGATPGGSMVFANGTSFEAVGLGTSNGMTLEAGLNVQLMDTLSVDVSYDGRLGSEAHQRVMFGVAFGF